MALTQVTGPYPIFTDLDGTPLDDGYLYIGAINDDPETNPIQVFWDAQSNDPSYSANPHKQWLCLSQRLTSTDIHGWGILHHNPQ
jgi:hypothetical protein